MKSFTTFTCCIFCWLSWRYIILPQYQEQDSHWGDEYREQNLVTKERAALLTILFWSGALVAILFLLEPWRALVQAHFSNALERNRFMRRALKLYVRYRSWIDHHIRFHGLSTTHTSICRSLQAYLRVHHNFLWGVYLRIWPQLQGSEKKSQTRRGWE